MSLGLNLQPTAEQFLADVRCNPVNAELLDTLPALGLPDCWLVAGCLFQTVWNLQTGQPTQAQINDYDVFYFDAHDLSAEAEAAVQSKVQTAYAHLGVTLEAVNQARVHLWYPAHFGEAYPALGCSEESLGRYLVECTCVGLRPAVGQTPKLAAPNGLADLYAGVLRPNWFHRAELYERKCRSYMRRWPHLHMKDHS